MSKSKGKPDFYVLTRVIDDSDSYWNTRATVVGTLDQINAIVDLSKRVPYGWRLLKGKQAQRYLKKAAREEVGWQREQAALKAMGGAN